MSYQVLARKWRPQNFKQMVGQEHVLRALIHALESQRLHHAYLFTGTRGVGKTTIARILAKCLSCDNGITAEPCGTCGACQSIAQGRYIDLIEIDAASRTKVEDMRELLDNVQYSPSEGRFKIYLIDEVHMLSTSSFNALLKTLEEPPEHVKFLFATTDPHKLPVTILSRCLQFNLKNMSPEAIVGQLKFILGEEQVAYDEASLWSLARAADGSMRDALSLTDQAIAYGNHQLTDAGVSAMLGTVDQKRIYRILDFLVAHNAAGMLTEVAALAEFSPDYTSVLAALATILHRVAVEQVVPGATDNSMGDQQQVVYYARHLCAEDVQLFYQIALVSRKDLAITPDPRAGLEMALLRMMAFQLQVPSTDDRPVLSVAEVTPPIEAYEADLAQESDDEAERPEPVVKEMVTEKKTPLTELTATVGGASTSMEPEPSSGGVEISTEVSGSAVVDANIAVNAEPVEADSIVVAADAATEGVFWPQLAAQLGLSGMTQNLLFNMAFEARQQELYLYVDEGHFRLLNDNHEERIRAALLAKFGSDKTVIFVKGLTAGQETPLLWRQRKRAELLAQAKLTLRQDPNVQQLLEVFEGALLEDSIQVKGELI